jgi:cytochrome b6-f complex iron-sulfur subunit
LKLDSAGVFYEGFARTFIVHLDKETRFLLTGGSLESQLSDDVFTRDEDGSYWLALYQRCVHLGTPVAFRNECESFKCPSHGAHYHCDGEYLDGPAPRSMDRFPLTFHNDHVLVDTGRIMHVPHPDDTTRLLPMPLVPCLS